MRVLVDAWQFFKFVVFSPISGVISASIWACFGGGTCGHTWEARCFGWTAVRKLRVEYRVPGWHVSPSCDLKNRNKHSWHSLDIKWWFIIIFKDDIPFKKVFFVSGTHLIKGGKDKSYSSTSTIGVDSRKRVSIVSCSVKTNGWQLYQELCNIPFKGTYLQEPQATLHESNSWIILEIFGDFLDMLAPSFLNFQDVVCSPASAWLYILDIAWWFTKNLHKFLQRHPSRQGDGIGSTTFVAFCGWAHQRLRFYYLTWGAINEGLGREIRTEKLPEISRSMTFWTSLLESFLPVASSKQVWE